MILTNSKSFHSRNVKLKSPTKSVASKNPSEKTNRSVKSSRYVRKKGVKIKIKDDVRLKMKKMKNLVTLEDKTSKISNYMNNLEDTLKTFKKNINISNNPLMITNLAKISFKRSLDIRKKLRKIEYLNKKFEKDYHLLKINDNYIGIKEKEVHEDYNNKLKKEKIIRDANFKNEEKKIFKLLYKPNENGLLLSNYKQDQKLKELKEDIEYICGGTEDENIKNLLYLKKISHYENQVKNPTFMRQKTNSLFSPCIKYDNSNLFFKKKYELLKGKMGKKQNLVNYKKNTINVSSINNLNSKKGKKIFFLKTEGSKNSDLKYKSTIAQTFKTDISQKSELNENPNNDINQLLNYKYKTNSVPSAISRKSNICSITENSQTNQRYSRTYNKLYNMKKMSKKEIIPKLFELLDDNYDFRKNLEYEFNIAKYIIDDFKQKPKKKEVKVELDLEKIKKEFNLYNVPSFINEYDIFMNNIKNIKKKIINKRYIDLMVKIAKTIIRQDTLANKDLIHNYNSYNAKLKKISERKLYSKRNDEADENKDLEKENRIEMKNLFKTENPDFLNINYLENLIKRYKTMQLK